MLFYIVLVCAKLIQFTFIFQWLRKLKFSKRKKKLFKVIEGVIGTRPHPRQDLFTSAQWGFDWKPLQSFKYFTSKHSKKGRRYFYCGDVTVEWKQRNGVKKWKSRKVTHLSNTWTYSLALSAAGLEKLLQKLPLSAQAPWLAPRRNPIAENVLHPWLLIGGDRFLILSIIAP